MNRALVRVVKVGGSLLDWPRLPRALRIWLARQAAAVNVLMCGGGPIVDVVREASRVYSLDDEAAHWLAVDCLAVTARALAAICKDELVLHHAGLTDFVCAGKPVVLVYDPRDFLTHHEAAMPGPVLPHDWTATS